MADDYRSTKYCPELTDLQGKKDSVRRTILAQHPRARDMHTYISDNDKPFKELFLDVYNGKCAYCGVSIKIIPWKMFEIDHLIPRTAKRFGRKKANAGYMDNLVLSCYDCNRAKSNFEVRDEELQKIHPDKTGITESFTRDDDYYIRISDEMEADETVTSFYKEVDLGNQLHRIDYLLLNMYGLCESISNEHPAYGRLMDAVSCLQEKRNVVR